MAHLMGYGKVIIEGDALNVTDALHRKKIFQNHVFHFVEDIRQVVSSFNSLLVSHVRRVGNTVAHYVTRLDPSSGTELVLVNNFPQGVLTLVEMDLE